MHGVCYGFMFCCKQKTAYELRISDWSSDVCSSDLLNLTGGEMVNFREAFKISIAFVGVVVGAGFASGQEIMQFFTSFGMVGLVGAVISGALFIFLAMALSTLGQQQASLSPTRVI